VQAQVQRLCRPWCRGGAEVQVIVQVLQVLQRFSSGAERFRFNRPVVQSSGVQRCRQVQS
jgi:hypothetical protein